MTQTYLGRGPARRTPQRRRRAQVRAVSRERQRMTLHDMRLALARLSEGWR